MATLVTDDGCFLCLRRWFLTAARCIVNVTTCQLRDHKPEGWHFMEVFGGLYDLRQPLDREVTRRIMRVV